MNFNLIDIVFSTNCQGCGEPPKELCRRCVLVSNPSWLTRFDFPVLKVSDYSEDLEKVIRGYKDFSLVSLEKHLANLLAQEFDKLPLALINLVLTPARNKQNFRKRGFDPADRIVRAAMQRLGDSIPVKRFQANRRLMDQRGLSRFDREQNLFGSFEARDLAGSNVLLFDDVLTTGATLQEMHRAATSAGANVVAGCVLAERILKN